jgi:hypothetical protein
LPRKKNISSLREFDSAVLFMHVFMLPFSARSLTKLKGQRDALP